MVGYMLGSASPSGLSEESFTTDELAAADLQLALECTIMAIRETLMDYFKGSCVRRVTGRTNINLIDIQAPRIRHTYERQRWALKAPKMVVIGYKPIIMVEKNPNVVKFKTAILKRSPEFRAIRQETEAFLEKYLRGVQVQGFGGGRYSEVDDSELILKNIPNSPRTEDEDLYWGSDLVRPVEWTRTMTSNCRIGPVDPEFINLIQSVEQGDLDE